MRETLIAICLLFASAVTAQEIATETETIAPTAEQIDFLGITNADKLSAATKRALRWPDLGNEWFVQFQTQDLKGDLAFEKGVCRRDPSAMIKENGKYYVWYTRGIGETQGFGGDVEKDKVFPWDRCDIWYATSTDGWTWQEEGLAVPRGEPGSYDDRSVFTTEIMKHDGMYYLYYKGEQMGEEITFGGRQIRHGVAIADSPQGPYIKSPYNPISNSGHEVCVWRYNGGVASLITTDGPEKNTIQWSPDGINFDIMSVIKDAPHAIGLNRAADREQEPTEILRWGLTHHYVTGDYQTIRRFSSSRVRRHVAPVAKGD